MCRQRRASHCRRSEDPNTMGSYFSPALSWMEFQFGPVECGAKARLEPAQRLVCAVEQHRSYQPRRLVLRASASGDGSTRDLYWRWLVSRHIRRELCIRRRGADGCGFYWCQGLNRGLAKWRGCCCNLAQQHTVALRRRSAASSEHFDCAVGCASYGGWRLDWARVHCPENELDGNEVVV